MTVANSTRNTNHVLSVWNVTFTLRSDFSILTERNCPFRSTEGWPS